MNRFDFCNASLAWKVLRKASTFIIVSAYDTFLGDCLDFRALPLDFLAFLVDVSEEPMFFKRGLERSFDNFTEKGLVQPVSSLIGYTSLMC